MDDFTTIVYEEIGPVCRILFNRPEVRNAQNDRLLRELDQALDRAEAAEPIRVVILGGRGPSFSAGHDLKVGPPEEGYLSRPAVAEQRWTYERRRFFDQAMRLREFPKPTIAQVQGHCLAAALILANLCDLIVAAEDAKFGDPVLRMGATSNEVMILPWVVGPRRAKRALFTGDPIDARTAQEWGIVSDVVPTAELEAYTLQLAERIARMPPFALQMVKRSINTVWDVMGLRAALDSHFNVHVLGHSTVEAKQYLEPPDRGAMKVKDFIARRDRTVGAEPGS